MTQYPTYMSSVLNVKDILIPQVEQISNSKDILETLRKDVGVVDRQMKDNVRDLTKRANKLHQVIS